MKLHQTKRFLGIRDVYWDGEWITANIYEMEKLLPGNVIQLFPFLNRLPRHWLCRLGLRLILMKIVFSI